MTIIEALKESRESGTSYMRVHGGGAKGSSPLLKAINKPSNDIYRPAPSAIRSGKPDVLKWARMNAGTGTPRPVERPAWLAQAKERLGVLGRLPDGWGGSEKPSERTLAVAWSLVQSMERYGHPVSRIAPMADGSTAARGVRRRDSSSASLPALHRPGNSLGHAANAAAPRTAIRPGAVAAALTRTRHE